MTCPRTETGQPLCHIVDHPDRLNESFCSTCNLRFQKDQSLYWNWGMFPFLLSVAITMAVLSGGSRQAQYEVPEPQPQLIPRFVAPPISQSVDVMPPGHSDTVVG
jgi:hypothetical protein